MWENLTGEWSYVWDLLSQKSVTPLACPPTILSSSCPPALLSFSCTPAVTSSLHPPAIIIISSDNEARLSTPIAHLKPHKRLLPASPEVILIIDSDQELQVVTKVTKQVKVKEEYEARIKIEPKVEMESCMSPALIQCSHQLSGNSIKSSGSETDGTGQSFSQPSPSTIFCSTEMASRLLRVWHPCCLQATTLWHLKEDCIWEAIPWVGIQDRNLPFTIITTYGNQHPSPCTHVMWTMARPQRAHGRVCDCSCKISQLLMHSLLVLWLAMHFHFVSFVSDCTLVLSLAMCFHFVSFVSNALSFCC